MPNKQRWRRLEFCSACRLDEVSSKWHRVANTELDLFICHRVYQANRKDLIKAKAETKDEGSRKAAVAAAPSRAKGTWGGSRPHGPRKAAVAAAPTTCPGPSPKPRPAKRTRKQAFLEDCYHSELVYGNGTKENLAAIEAMLGYAPKSQ
jgi:hypothetical protein